MSLHCNLDPDTGCSPERGHVKGCERLTFKDGVRADVTAGGWIPAAERAELAKKEPPPTPPARRRDVLPSNPPDQKDPPR